MPHRAALRRLCHAAQDGKEGLSVSQVARRAGVNRGTAYQHFQTREQLIEATVEWVSEKLHHAVYGDLPEVAGQKAGSRGIKPATEQLAKTKYAQPGIDTEVVSVLMLAGMFLWPVWARAHTRTAKERQQMGKRFSREVLRLSLHGTLRP